MCIRPSPFNPWIHLLISSTLVNTTRPITRHWTHQQSLSNLIGLPTPFGNKYISGCLNINNLQCQWSFECVSHFVNVLKFYRKKSVKDRKISDNHIGLSESVTVLIFNIIVYNRYNKLTYNYIIILY